VAGFAPDVRDYIVKLILRGGGRRHHTLTLDVTKVFLGAFAEDRLVAEVRRHPCGAKCVPLSWLIHTVFAAAAAVHADTAPREEPRPADPPAASATVLPPAEEAAALPAVAAGPTVSIRPPTGVGTLLSPAADNENVPPAAAEATNAGASAVRTVAPGSGSTAGGKKGPPGGVKRKRPLGATQSQPSPHSEVPVTTGNRGAIGDGSHSQSSQGSQSSTRALRSASKRSPPGPEPGPGPGSRSRSPRRAEGGSAALPAPAPAPELMPAPSFALPRAHGSGRSLSRGPLAAASAPSVGDFFVPVVVGVGGGGGGTEQPKKRRSLLQRNPYAAPPAVVAAPPVQQPPRPRRGRAQESYEEESQVVAYNNY